MEDRRIPKTNNILESRYSTTESNYNNNRRFKTVEGANKIFNFIKTLENGVLSKLGIAYGYFKNQRNSNDLKLSLSLLNVMTCY